jgi:hypothetical protein
VPLAVVQNWCVPPGQTDAGARGDAVVVGVTLIERQQVDSE